MFSPRLLIRPNRATPPVVYCLGTKPIHAENERLVSKCIALFTVVTTSVAVISPIPGILKTSLAKSMPTTLIKDIWTLL